MAEFKPFRLGEAISQGQQLAGNAFRLGEQTREINARGSLETAIQDGTPEAMAEHRKQYPVEAMKFDATKAAANIQKMQEVSLRADVMGRLAHGVVDEDSYQRALQQARDAGVEVNGAPPNYDPNFIQQFKDQALTVKQRVDASIKNAEFELRRRTQGETERHNRAMEGIGRQKAAGKDQGVKTAVYNSANASTATLFGGVYDPATGRISGLDKESSTRALQVSARAQELLTEGKVKEPAVAVKMAAKEMGINVGQDKPTSIPEPSQRQKDTVYQTPRGPMRWSGTGWIPQ